MASSTTAPLPTPSTSATSSVPAPVTSSSTGGSVLVPATSPPVTSSTIVSKVNVTANTISVDVNWLNNCITTSVGTINTLAGSAIVDPNNTVLSIIRFVLQIVNAAAEQIEQSTSNSLTGIQKLEAIVQLFYIVIAVLNNQSVYSVTNGAVITYTYVPAGSVAPAGATLVIQSIGKTVINDSLYAQINTWAQVSVPILESMASLAIAIYNDAKNGVSAVINDVEQAGSNCFGCVPLFSKLCSKTATN